MIFDKLGQSLIGYIARQAVRHGLKTESRRPKGTIVAKKELGDCLSVGTYPTYGNGAFILSRGSSTFLKEGRKYLFKSTPQHNGFRCYSKEVCPPPIKPEKAILDGETTKGDLPRRFEKLINLCATPKDGLKISDIYKLMFNARLYEVAYQKLKSNPGNMTPGIIPVTLDGMSTD
jgi:hypothetical protein